MRQMQALARLWAIPLCAAMAETAALPAREIELDLDPARTHIEFALGATLHTVHGSFQLKRGSVHFDPETGQASGEIVIDAASGNTGNADRDQRMHKDVLESARFPEIVFIPDHVAGRVQLQGAFQAQLHGVVRIHGSEHELMLPVEAQAADGQITATTRFTVPYAMWGMKNPSTLLLRVSGKVEVAIHAVARIVQ
jgi:polyisoprenoid-binding protein YceI